MSTSPEATIVRNYAPHLQHLTLKGLKANTLEACSRVIRRIGERFDHRIDALLFEQDRLDSLTELVASNSWRSINRGRYGLKVYYEHVRRQPCAMPGLIKPPRIQRLLDIVTVEEAGRIVASGQVLS